MRMIMALMLLALGVPVWSQGAKPGDAEFKALIDRYYQAWSSANPDNAAPLYAKDPELVFYDLAPMKYTGWAEYKAGVQKAFFDNMESGKLTPKDDLKVNRKGNWAWTTVTGHMSAKMKNGQAVEADFRHTAIWEKSGGKWVIVHEHVSAPMP